MTVRRFAATGLSLLTAVSLALAGCTSKGDSDGGGAGDGGSGKNGASASQLSAKDQLLASASVLRSTPYGFTAHDMTLTATGAADPASRSATYRATGAAGGVTVDIAAIAINNDIWTKMNLGADHNKALGVKLGKWMHVDVTKLGDSANLPIVVSENDALEITQFMSGVTDAAWKDTHTITGTFDLTAVAGPLSFDKDVLDKMGDKAKALPFTVTLDDQSRLSSITVDTSRADAKDKLDVAFSAYGKQPKINKPTEATTVEAPKKIISAFFTK